MTLKEVQEEFERIKKAHLENQIKFAAKVQLAHKILDDLSDLHDLRQNKSSKKDALIEDYLDSVREKLKSLPSISMINYCIDIKDGRVKLDTFVNF